MFIGEIAQLKLCNTEVSPSGGQVWIEALFKIGVPADVSGEVVFSIILTTSEMSTGEVVGRRA